MAPKKILVKRHGRMEEYDKRKIYASVYAAALNAHYGEQDAERLADRVMKKVDKTLRDEDEITSDQIRDYILEELGSEHEDVAYLYEHHLDIN